MPPSIDYSAMRSRQSDARNKVVAPVFKRLGIIDQWGNGLKLVAEEMKDYPEIEMKWKEVGLSFQIQFIKKNYVGNTDIEDVTDGGNGGVDVTNVTNDVTNERNGNLEDSGALLLDLLRQDSNITTKKIAEVLGLSERQCKRIIANLKKQGVLTRKGANRTGYWIIK